MYQAPVEDMKFVLRNLVGLDEVAALNGMDMVSDDLVEALAESDGVACLVESYSFSFCIPWALSREFYGNQRGSGHERATRRPNTNTRTSTHTLTLCTARPR